MNETDPIHPLKDVWLRPRRVFGELAKQPIGPLDYALAAAQGIAGRLLLAQLQPPEARLDAWNIVAIGPLVGLFGTTLFAFIYSRIGKRLGGNGNRNEVFHILAYSGVPVVASVLAWILAFLVLGEAPVLNGAGNDAEIFFWLISRIEFAICVFLSLWSFVLQVMGFSQIFGLSVRKSIAVWALGQLAGALAVVLLDNLLAGLFPQLVAGPPA